MRGKAGTAHPGRTAAQRRVLEQIWCGNHSPAMVPWTRYAMLRAGLIVRIVRTAGRDRFGAIRTAEFAMPIAVHIRLCEAMAAECPDEDAVPQR